MTCSYCKAHAKGGQSTAGHRRDAWTGGCRRFKVEIVQVSFFCFGLDDHGKF